jgi:hypothetical protein
MWTAWRCTTLGRSQEFAETEVVANNVERCVLAITPKARRSAGRKRGWKEDNRRGDFHYLDDLVLWVLRSVRGRKTLCSVGECNFRKPPQVHGEDGGQA